MTSLHPHLAGAIARLGEHWLRHRAVHEDRDLALDEVQPALDRVDADLQAEVERIDASRELWPQDDAVRDGLEAFLRARREARHWNEYATYDDPGAYDPFDAYWDALENLFWIAGDETLSSRIGTHYAPEPRLRWCPEGEPRQVAEIAREIRSLVDRLGPAPWDRADSADAARRLSVLGAMLADEERSLDAPRPTRLAVRRVARALWSLERLRITEARAVWGELERACRALAGCAL